jgi:hypothetical protein
MDVVYKENSYERKREIKKRGNKKKKIKKVYRE